MALVIPTAQHHTEGMKRFWTSLLIGLAALVGIVQAVFHRLRHGPAVPGWSWSTELTRAALAATTRTAVRHSDFGLWSTARLATPPLSASVRRRVDVVRAQAGGVHGEWIHVRGAEHDQPVLLYLHGGGYVMGSPAMERPFITSMALEAGASDVFSADYRLAPKHRYPAAVEDAVSSYLGMLEGGVDPDRLVIVGDSAGGGLAMALLVSLRDAGHRLPAGAVLLSPWVDLANTASTIITHRTTDYLPAMANRPALEYLGDADPTEPTASPLYADLTGLPPLLIMAGGREMILEDATRLADRARSAGVDVTLVIEPDMYHVWPVILPRHQASTRAVRGAGEWIQTMTGPRRASA